MIRISDIDIEAMDRGAIQSNYFTGWRAFVWIFFGDRRFMPNKSTAGSVMTYCFLLVVLCCMWAVFKYLPLKLLSFPVTVGATITMWQWPITHANQSRMMVLVHALIGVLGLILKPPIVLTLFGFSLTHALYLGFVISGTLAILRRGWNAIIWQVLGRLIIDYCQANQRYIPSKLSNSYLPKRKAA